MTTKAFPFILIETGGKGSSISGCFTSQDAADRAGDERASKHRDGTEYHVYARVRGFVTTTEVKKI